MKNRNHTRLLVEQLEDRLVPAFNFTTDLAGNLTISGCPDFDATNPAPGSSDSVTVNEFAPSMFSVTETPFVGAPVTIISNITVLNSLSVDFSRCNTNDFLIFNLNGNTLNGNLTVREGAGSDAAVFGTTGTILGNLSLNNVNNVDTSIGINVGGNFSMNNSLKNLPANLILGLDNIGGNVTVTNGNGGIIANSIGLNAIGGNITFTAGNGNNTLGLAGGDVVGGSLTYLGGSGSDSVTTIGTAIGGNVYANLGAANLPGSLNVFAQNAGSVYGRNLTVLAGASSLTVPSNIVTLAGLTGGSAYFNLGIGNRIWSFAPTASINGPSITYSGTGAGTNTVLFFGKTANSTANFTLGNGTATGGDTFTLGPATQLASLYIDFGLNAPGIHDTFLNLSGSTQPRLTLRNLG